MPVKIAIFYHCVFQIYQQRLPAAVGIFNSQMKALEDSGLLFETDNFFIGVNGDNVTLPVTYPEKATVVHHGLKCRTELRTLRMLEKWLPGHEDWLVLWFHAKGATKSIGFKHTDKWRDCSMHHLVKNWVTCVRELKRGYDSVGVHFMTGDETPPGQSIWAGNMFWATGKFLLTLPLVMERDRIKESGLDSLDSRYESEVWIGNGPKLPRVYDFCPGWHPGKTHIKVPNLNEAVLA